MAAASDFKFGAELEFVNAHQKWAWRWAKEAPKYLGLPSNISATAEGSDFKIGKLLGFAQARHQIPH